MDYGFTAYYNDAGISTTTIYAIAEGVTYARNYGASALNQNGFGGSMRFTASPASGYDFIRWAYRLGSVSGTLQYAYSNPFTYAGGQDIYIRAESQVAGGGTAWTLAADTIGTVSALSETYVNLGARVLKVYDVQFAQSGLASFYTTGAMDTVGYVTTTSAWDSSAGTPTTILAQNDDANGSSNFAINYNVVAGTTYKIWVRMHDPSGTGQFALHIAPPGQSTAGTAGIYIWTGAQWVTAHPYVHNGTTWVAMTPCIYSGDWYQPQ